MPLTIENEAVDLRKCLAIYGNSAFREWDTSLLAREKPNDPAVPYEGLMVVKEFAGLAPPSLIPI